VADEWNFYLFNVNDTLASIYVNLGLRASIPIAAKPWLLWVWVYFNSPRPDGLSSSEEAPTLYAIEDALTDKLTSERAALLSGRITTAGRREFYYYGESKDGFRQAVAGAMRSFHGYRFDLGERRDPLWEQYLDVLYPTPEQMERIKNREVLDVLEKHGDVHSVPRIVRHWLYFPSEQLRAGFREVALQEGFTIDDESIVETTLPFGLTLAREEPVEQPEIDKTVAELVRKVQKFDGEYDGWETQVVTQ
jgi:uncharacterized protein (TIGR01619 family)